MNKNIRLRQAPKNDCPTQKIAGVAPQRESKERRQAAFHQKTGLWARRRSLDANGALGKTPLP
ncbi:MAG TPA: hypothetical protein PLA10_01210 [Clostridiales bacterium]|nr:hypothetical protein [Clostridiales bacterium]HOL78629.1 hypothetical protein [Clostridiales bacterium]